MDFLLPLIIVSVIAIISGLCLGVANHFMKIKNDPKTNEILSALPGANCGSCGFSGCIDYAVRLADGKEKNAGLCPVGGKDVADKIGELIGTDTVSFVPMTAVVQCVGNNDCTDKKTVYQGINSCRAASMFFGGDSSCRFGCMGYGDCLNVCEYNAIKICNGVAQINPDLCKACKKCLSVCPKNIIEVVPKNNSAVVLCSNTDKGSETKKVCSVGCLACKLCLKACEAGAISFNGFNAVIDFKKCTGCGKCVDACKLNIIKLNK